MQKPIVEFKKSYFFGLLAVLLWMPLPWLYLHPPQFLQGQPLAIYAIVFFLAGISSAALATFFVLKRRMSSTAARIYSILFLLTGLSAYQLSGFAPSWTCFGKQLYVATANAAGQNCTTRCTNNDRKPCSGWSSCWDKFVSCNSAGRDQDGRGCSGCCFACEVICQEESDPDQPPTISSSISCSQTGDNGWCIGTEVLTLTASDPQGYTLTITGDIGGSSFTCPTGNTCFQPIPQGAGTINYSVTAAQSGLSRNGSTTWKLDATRPSINGTLTGSAGSNGWYLGSVTYNGSASDSLSGLASFTCTLNGASLGSCNSISVNNEGVHTLAFTARDNAGNTQTFNQTISIDLQNPVLNSSISGTLGSNNWYNAATLNASASDAAPGSGLWVLEYNLDSGSWTRFPASGSLDLAEGQHTINVRAVDLAGRITTATKSYGLDRELPSITITPSGTLGLNNWYITPLTVSASASDNTSGMDVFEYSLNNGTWTTYSSPLTLNDGTQSLSFWAQDVSGLVRQVDESYQVDTRSPQISGNLSGVLGTNGWYISQVTISAAAVDPSPGSGVEALTYILNGGAETPYTNPLTLADGEHTIQFNARDLAGLTDSSTQTIKVDTTKPSLNIGTTLPAWNMGMVTLNGTASDSGSGLSKVEFSRDGTTWQAVTGTTSWSYDWDTTKVGSGSHHVHVRATDQAGLTSEQLLKVGVDNSAPKIHLPEEWFQWDTVTLDVWDNDSGLSEVRVEISDPEGRWKTRKIQLDPNEFPMDFKWDRRFGDDTVAPLGTYPVKVIAFDHLGNMTRVGATIKILLGILPAGPTATAQPYLRLDATPTILSTPSLIGPTVTSAPWMSTFGATPEPPVQPTPTHAASPRATPTKTTILDWIESIFVPNTTEETITDVNSPEADPNGFWGATLAAVTGAMTAFSLAEKRKREEKEAGEEERRAKRKAQKMEKLEAQWAQERAWEAARSQEKATPPLPPGISPEAQQAFLHGGTAAQGWISANIAKLQQAYIKQLEVARAIQKRNEEKKRAEEEAKAEKIRAAWAAYSNAARKEDTIEKIAAVTPTKKKTWWEKTVDWIDDHQTEIALGIGVVVGVTAIVLTAGLATPLVAAAVVAGATVSAGVAAASMTVGLNTYYDRPWHENLLKNVVIAGGAALVVSTAGFILQGASTAIGGYCTVHPSTCARVEPFLNAWDKVEETWLRGKLAYQTWTGDQAGAADTAFELYSEYADGGMPGNTVAKELGDQLVDLRKNALPIIKTYGNDVIPLLVKYGDEGLALIQKFGPDGVNLLRKYGNDATDLIVLEKDVLDYAVQQGPDAVAALSRWSKADLLAHGPELALRAKKDAEVLADIKKLTLLGPIDPQNLTAEQKGLIEAIAANSTQYADNGQVVLGKWVDNSSGFVQTAQDTGSVHYNPHPDMWTMLGKLGDAKQEEVAWLINKQVVQNGIAKGLPFEYTLNGIPTDAISRESAAIRAIFSHKSDTEIMKILKSEYMPVRMKELQELQKAGYEFTFDNVNKSFILVKK